MDSISKPTIMNKCSDIDNLIKKTILLGTIDKLYQIRSYYGSGDNAKGEWMISNLIEDLKEMSQKNSTF